MAAGKRIPLNDVQKIHQMRNEGSSIREIAEELGYSNSGVWKYVQGNTFPYKLRIMINHQAVLDLREKNLSYKKIARLTGYSATHCIRICKADALD